MSASFGAKIIRTVAHIDKFKDRLVIVQLIALVIEKVVEGDDRAGNERGKVRSRAVTPRRSSRLAAA
jgi:hypothetical protein